MANRLTPKTVAPPRAGEGDREAVEGVASLFRIGATDSAFAHRDTPSRGTLSLPAAALDTSPASGGGNYGAYNRPRSGSD